jgi:hypothetical protein
MLSSQATTQRASFALFNGSANPETVGTSSLGLNEWHSVAGVYDGTNLRLFVDGIEESSVPAGMQPVPSVSPIEFGRWPNQTFLFAGDVQDIAILGRAASEAEIRELSLGGQPPADATAFFTFSDPNARGADQMGSAHSLSFTGDVQFLQSCVP